MARDRGAAIDCCARHAPATAPVSPACQGQTPLPRLPTIIAHGETTRCDPCHTRAVTIDPGVGTVARSATGAPGHTHAAGWSGETCLRRWPHNERYHWG